VVPALKQLPGVESVAVSPAVGVSARGPAAGGLAGTLTVTYQPSRVTATQIVRTAQQALEADPADPYPVTVVWVRHPAAQAEGTRATSQDLTLLNGQVLPVPDGHPLLLFFMSAQCGSCLAGEQQLHRLAATLPPTVQLVSVDVTPEYDPPKLVADMARVAGAWWPQAYAAAPVLQAYHVTQLDQVAVLAPDGRLLYDGALPSNAVLRHWLAQAVP
jgi:copper chaperone CopZ